MGRVGALEKRTAQAGWLMWQATMESTRNPTWTWLKLTPSTVCIGTFDERWIQDKALQRIEEDDPGVILISLERSPFPTLRQWN